MVCIKNVKISFLFVQLSSVMCSYFHVHCIKTKINLKKILFHFSLLNNLSTKANRYFELHG